jgi:hypothetical protein
VNKIIDPTDGKTEYPSVAQLIKHYTKDFSMNLLACMIDQLRATAEPGGPPDGVLQITGTAGDQTVAHGLGSTPSTYHLQGFTRVDTFVVKSMNATSITVLVEPAGGAVQLALYK